ncbi:MAG: DUF2065 domain-containing protein [Pseudomonadota bacterium]
MTVADIVRALALVAVIEGLAYALAPSHMRAFLMEMLRLSPEQFRQAGFLVAALGAVVLMMVA